MESLFNQVPKIFGKVQIVAGEGPPDIIVTSGTPAGLPLPNVLPDLGQDFPVRPPAPRRAAPPVMGLGTAVQAQYHIHFVF